MQRVIRFLKRTRQPYLALVTSAEPDATWNIVIHLIESEITGTPVTLSTLVSVSQVPYATGLRRIHRMIDEGVILKRSRSKTGKSVHPASQPRPDGAVRGLCRSDEEPVGRDLRQGGGERGRGRLLLRRQFGTRADRPIQPARTTASAFSCMTTITSPRCATCGSISAATGHRAATSRCACCPTCTPGSSPMPPRRCPNSTS